MQFPHPPPGEIKPGDGRCIKEKKREKQRNQTRIPSHGHRTSPGNSFRAIFFCRLHALGRVVIFLLFLFSGCAGVVYLDRLARILMLVYLFSGSDADPRTDTDT